MGIIVGSSGPAPAASGGAAAAASGDAAPAAEEEKKEEEKEEESDEDVILPFIIGMGLYKLTLVSFRWVLVYLIRLLSPVDCGWLDCCVTISSSWVKWSIAF